MIVRSEEARYQAMMAQAQVPKASLGELLLRLEDFVLPFADLLPNACRGRIAQYLTGLLSTLEHKTAEGIAYLFDQDRLPMQRFLGQSDWEIGRASCRERV